MTEHFVTYEQALALKELGFDEPCFMSFNPNPNWWDNQCTNSQLNSLNGGIKTVCAAPLKQQVFKFFREKYNLHGNMDLISNGWLYKTDNLKEYTMDHNFLKGRFNTYEEAESACIDKLIEIVKSK